VLIMSFIFSAGVFGGEESISNLVNISIINPSDW
jgi:hypothetical protein